MRTTRPPLLLLLVAALACAGILLFACEKYEAPPGVTLRGLASGVLEDPRAPLVIDFGMPVVESSVKVKVAFYDADLEGNLPDEDDDPATELRIILRHDDDGDLNVDATFDGEGAVLSLAQKAALPVGPKLVLIVEAGLRSTGGRERTFRTRIPLSYAVKCPPSARPTRFTSGAYFALLEVEKPIGTQVQILAAIDVDPASGAFVGQFTNADRIRDPGRCPTRCTDAEACRLLPSPACVVPSTIAGTVDEYPDFVPNASPPTGYSFEVRGCVVDDGEATNMLTFPATMVIQQPTVTVQGLVLSAQFTRDAKGAERATGSLTADGTLLGQTALGLGKGTMTARRIPEGEVPPGLPKPPPIQADAGAHGEGGT